MYSIIYIIYIIYKHTHTYYVCRDISGLIDSNDIRGEQKLILFSLCKLITTIESVVLFEDRL